MSKYFRFSVTVIGLLALFSGLNISIVQAAEQLTQKKMPVQTPPHLIDWSAPLEDPLHARSRALERTLESPVNMFGQNDISCATADYVSQTKDPTVAAKRLLEKENESESGLKNQVVPELSLLLALDLGLCHNPDIRATWHQIQVQSAALGQARSAYLPKLNAGITRQRSDTEYRNSDGTSVRNTSAYASLSWRLFDFGGRRSALDSAHFQLAAAVHSQNVMLQSVIIQMVQTYYDAQTAYASVAARAEMVELAQQTLDSANRRLKRGAGSQNDVLQAQSALARAQLEKTQSEGEYKKKLAELIYLVGLPANTSVMLSNALQEELKELSNPQTQEQQRIFINQALQDWLDQAKLHHPAIAVARAQLNAAQANISAVRAQGYPTIDFNMNYYRNGRPTDSATKTKSSEHNMAVTITFPLFSGFEHTYKVRGAQAQALAQKAEMDKVEQQIMLELVRAYSDAQAAWSNLDAAQLLYDSATLARQSAQRQFEKGAGDITQVVQAQNNLAEANLQRISAQAQWQAARLSLIVHGYAWN